MTNWIRYCHTSRWYVIDRCLGTIWSNQDCARV